MLNTHGADPIRGAMVFRSITHLKRLLFAIGENVVQYIDDFITFPVDDSTGDPTEWTATMVEAGTGNSTITQADQSGGAVVITTDDNDNDGVNAQLNGESFKLKTTNHLYFGAFGVKLSEVTQSDLFLGLSITDTDILGGATDSIGFRKVDASADLTFMVEKGSAETIVTGLKTLVAATEYDIEFMWDGAALEVFVDGVSVSKPAVTNLPDDEELRVSWHFLNGLADAPATCTIDKLVCIQIGR